MSRAQRSIIGAGIAGLVLGRCLRQRGVAAVVFERAQNRPRHNYAITLHPWAYRRLLKVLGLDEEAFRRAVAINGPVDRIGRVDSTPSDFDPVDVRANRSRFEDLLASGLDVRWEHELQTIRPADGGSLLRFTNGSDTDTDLVVGADGVHSRVRQLMSPTTQVKVLPYAVYNGKRRMSRREFDTKFAALMAGGPVSSCRISNSFLQVSINDLTDDKASLSYTYSRPASPPHDPLFRPDRPLTGASDISPALFDEIAELRSLEGGWKDVFDVAAMKKDRLLHWLMRSVLVDASDLEEPARTKSVVLIGDAVHAGPILGARGANDAIVDAVELADFIVGHDFQNLDAYYKRRYDDWRKTVDAAEQRLATLHGMQLSNL